MCKEGNRPNVSRICNLIVQTVKPTGFVSTYWFYLTLCFHYKILSKIMCLAHPVLSVACSLFQASLQSLSNPSCFLELLHQLFSVLQLIHLYDGLQGSDVALTGLLQRGDRQAGKSLLMGQVSARDPTC